MAEKPPENRRGLTKADLVDAVYERHGGLTKNEAGEVVSRILDTVKTGLCDGKRVKIKNFGVFEVRSRKGRFGVDPTSGEKIFIPSHRGLSFRPSPRLKNLVQRRRKKSDS